MIRPLRACVVVLGLATLACAVQNDPAAAARKPIRVVIWDEQQPAQKQAYENFLGNAIGDHLRKMTKGGDAEFEVKSVRLDDPQQGLTPETLDNCDVLVWWGHQRHGEVKVETGKEIVRRIKAGQLSLLAVHSAHFATPFIEAMNERTTDDALKTLSASERKNVKINYIQPQRRLYKKEEPKTPAWTKSQAADGSTILDIKLPSCVFNVVRADGSPSTLTTVAKDHPIAKGVPSEFTIPQTEIYGDEFYVPKPDAIIFSERWQSGNTFAESGSFWKLGKGKVFYFRPGHETFPIFKQEVPLRIMENACRFLGKK